MGGPYNLRERALHHRDTPPTVLTFRQLQPAASRSLAPALRTSRPVGALPPRGLCSSDEEELSLFLLLARYCVAWLSLAPASPTQGGTCCSISAPPENQSTRAPQQHERPPASPAAPARPPAAAPGPGVSPP